MTQTQLERWICSENIIQYRKRLADPADKVPRDQLEGLLLRELAKQRAMVFY